MQPAFFHLLPPSVCSPQFLAAGGCLLEDTEFKKAEVFEDGVRLLLSPVGAGRHTPIGVGDANR